MKKVPFLFIMAFAFVIHSCEGPSGPPGPIGPVGPSGGVFVAQSFETNGLDFTAANNYENLVIIPNNIDVLPTDMILVYLLWDENPDVWRLLPQTIYTSTGEFQYNFDFSFGDVLIFLDAPPGFDFGTLLPGDTLDQFFRVVVLPVDLLENNNIDVTNYAEVMQYVKD